VFAAVQVIATGCVDHGPGRVIGFRVVRAIDYLPPLFVLLYA